MSRDLACHVTWVIGCHGLVVSVFASKSSDPSLNTIGRL